MTLDRFDRQLLNLVQEDSGQTAERLAEQVGLSPSAIQRRLKRLREEGVLARRFALAERAGSEDEIRGYDRLPIHDRPRGGDAEEGRLGQALQGTRDESRRLEGGPGNAVQHPA